MRFHRGINIPVGKVTLPGELITPLKADAIIIFSHGNGSSRHSKHNQQVAKYLSEKKLNLW